MSTPLYLTNPQVFDLLRSLLPGGGRIYLVGGTVRDVLLERPIHDLDLVMAGADVRKTARMLADRLGGQFYMLDEERSTARVLLEKNGERFWVDFAGLRGETLESDLLARDFTINALATDVDQLDRLEDPLGGLTDLKEKRLRGCSPSAFKDDPLRVMRGVRLGLTLGFRLEAKTLEWMHQAAEGIVRVSPERQRDELINLLESGRVHSAIRLLDSFGLVELLMPELKHTQGVQQSAPHIEDVWNHTLAVCRELDTLFGVLVASYSEEKGASLKNGIAMLRLGRFREKFTQHFSQQITLNRNRRALLFFSALYHDVGKPEVRRVDAEGRIRFFTHEELSAQKLIVRSKALAFSQAEIDVMAKTIRGHMRIHQLANTGEPASPRSIYRFFKACGDAGVDICLLSLADLAGTYGETLPQPIWQAELEIVRQLLEAWWEQPVEATRPVRLLTGQELMVQFNLTAGPLIGKALEALLEAQVTGEVRTQAEAVNFMRDWLMDNSTERQE